jgi:hypothetical protein
MALELALGISGDRQWGISVICSTANARQLSNQNGGQTEGSKIDDRVT